MEYSAFVNHCRDPHFVWGINHRQVVRTVGPLGISVITGLVLLGLAPAAPYFIEAVEAGNFFRLLWFPLVVLALASGTPNLNLVDALPWWLIAGTCWLLSHWFSASAMAGGYLCLLTWYASGLLRGIAMSGLRSRLLNNSKLFERFDHAQCLLLPDA